MSDVQQTVQDVQAITPYIWEIVATCGIFVSLTITQWFKKRRFFPKFLCNLKESKLKTDGTRYKYKQLKPFYLDAIATIQTFIYVSGCLYIRYEAYEVLIVGFFASILQWKIIKIIFLKAQEKESSKLAQILKGDIYVPDDATMFVKTVAYMAGGGVDKKNGNPD